MARRSVTKHLFFKKILPSFLAWTLVILPFTIYGQTAVVKGKIKLRDGTPAAFASVICQTANLHAIADDKGEFTLTGLPDGRHTLRYRMLGHESDDTVEVVNGQAGFITGELNFTSNDLNEVVVTGQSEPMTLKNSVYQVRTISSEQIKLRGATNIQTVLNTELGIRLANDMALGTTDIELLGMNGQRVKVLLDGIPLSDRGEIRESIGQIDINTIDRIEIVEGPLSVIYGTDALAGVINLITKKGSGGRSLLVSARMQEETANSEYAFLDGNGVHNANLNVTFRHQPWEFSAGVSRNSFGGWQGASTGRAKSWIPKEQLLVNASLGYRAEKLTLWYRFNGTDEDLISRGDVFWEGSGDQRHQRVTDKKYTTWRFFHQLQGDYKINERLTVNLAGSYTDYSRKTLTTNTNLATGQTTLSLAEGSQDKSILQSGFGRMVATYKPFSALNLTGGVEYQSNRASGARIEGEPEITDLSAFITPELRFADGKINLRPGARFIYNSVYDAPPVIPSINAKWSLSKMVDLRIGYARGFRAPSLRELYFWFFDASHSMQGNPDLKAETSNSYNAYVNLHLLQTKEARLGVVIGGFYNQFRDFIGLEVDPSNPTIYTYLNIHKSKTSGGNINTHLAWKNWKGSLGFQLLGTFNELFASQPSDQLPELVWTPELNANLTYRFPAIHTSLNFSYKFTGKRPLYEKAPEGAPRNAILTHTSSFQMADLSISKTFGKNLSVNAGVRNLFDVTSLQNTATSSGAGHNAVGAIPMSYGRSYFLGIQYGLQLSR